ncbi:PHP domain-containing protein, partial [Candidatus Hydrogenedentota bacterium]
MLKTDLHTHTSFSRCGTHTYLEVLNVSRENGVELVAITDHGPASGGRMSNVFLTNKRFPKEYKGMQILKGIEANLTGLDGSTDIPTRLLSALDIVLIGLHPTPFKNEGAEKNTSALLKALDRFPAIDAVTHPDLC